MSEENDATIVKRIRITGWSAATLGAASLLAEPAAILWVNEHRPDLITPSLLGDLDPISANFSFLTVFGIPAANFFGTVSLSLTAKIHEQRKPKEKRLGWQQIIFVAGVIATVALLPMSLVLSLSMPSMMR